jgi:IS5 family transposase
MVRTPGLFDEDERLQRLSDIADQLEAFAAVADFEVFRPELDAALGHGDGAKGGRAPFDPVMMFKILVIQAQNDLSDNRAEFLINDRLLLHALPRAWGDEQGSRRQDHLGVPGAADPRRRHRGAVRALQRRDPRGRMHPHGGSDRGREPRLRAAPRQRNTEDDRAEIKAAGACRRCGRMSLRSCARRIALDAGLRQGAAASGRHEAR